jgi:hypothetical protein
MAGKIDVPPTLDPAPEKRGQEAGISGGALNHLHADCNLADSANRQCAAQHKPEPTSGQLDLSTPATSASNTLKPTDKAPDGASKPNDVPKTEDEYMKIASAEMRKAYKLPKDATSKQLVDAVVGNEARAILHAPKVNQKAYLDILKVDEKTQNQILANNKDSVTALRHVMVKQERAFLDIPPTLKGEPAFKAMEKGIELNQYRAAADIAKLHKFMSEP